MTDRERWGLHGPVSDCGLQRTWYSNRCSADACGTEERGDITKLEFRANGFLARRHHLNPDGSEWTATYWYADAGRLGTVRTEDGSGRVNLVSYEYDMGGRLTRIIEHCPGAADRISESYEYDESGRKKKTLYVDSATQRQSVHYAWGVEGTDTCYSAPGAATLVTLHNPREQPTHLYFYDSAQGLLSRIKFFYDLNGNLADEAQTNMAEALPPQVLSSLNPEQIEAVRGLFGTRRTHRYDKQNRRIETRSEIGRLGSDCKKMAYNARGDLIEEVMEHEDREYGMDAEGRISDAPSKLTSSRSEARFHYEYDHRGNWVVKTVESRSGSDDTYKLSSVERRVIGYFE